jgi:NAD(P)-dependent dehydrogenase (short-subunit alcohol dehydrogenase family)
MDPAASPRIALVTGAASGIGKATTRALLADGWHVMGAGRQAERLAAMCSALCSDLGTTHPDVASRLAVQTADVTDAGQVAGLFEALIARWGRIDLLFNNAGVFTQGVALEDLPLAAWREAVDTNLTGAFLCTQQAFKWMKAQTPCGGRIINNGSISAHVPRPDSVAYTATKHAITGLTKAAALDGRAFGIAVGQIDIGNAASDMTATMATGMRQADGSVRPEAVMDVRHAADAVVHMARLPLTANVLSMTVMATGMPFVGRG